MQVWDGTKCAHPLLNVTVAPEALEGVSSPVQHQANMIANVLVYDNHVEGASMLKVRRKKNCFPVVRLNVALNHNTFLIDLL